MGGQRKKNRRKRIYRIPAKVVKNETLVVSLVKIYLMHSLYCVNMPMSVSPRGWEGVHVDMVIYIYFIVSKPNHLKDMKKENSSFIKRSSPDKKHTVLFWYLHLIYLHLNKHTLCLEAQLTLTQAPSVAHLVGGERAELCRRPHSSLTAVETVWREASLSWNMKCSIPSYNAKERENVY